MAGLPRLTGFVYGQSLLVADSVHVHSRKVLMQQLCHVFAHGGAFGFHYVSKFDRVCHGEPCPDEMSFALSRS